MTTPRRYEVLGRVATTRTGAVWKARDVALDRVVALKEISVADRDALYREASAIAGLASEHIVAVYGVEEDGTSAYLVEEWVEGATVAAVVRANGRMPAAQALSVMRGALLGLAAAHRAGLVHGDISTSNILVDASGRARLIDFGSVTVTGTAARPATGAFAAPEVLAGRPATPAADVYASAGVLAALLHGRIERTASTSGVGGPVKTVLDRALNPTPELRYPDAGALLTALDAEASRAYGVSWWSQAGLGAAATASIAALVPLGAAAAGAAIVAGAGASSAATSTAASAGGASTGAGIAAPGAHLASVTSSQIAKSVGKGAWHSRRLWIGLGATAAVATAGIAIAVTAASNNSPQRPLAGGSFTSTSTHTPASSTATPGTSSPIQTTPPSPPGSYSGLTSQGRPLGFYVSSDRSNVQNISILTVGLSCTPGGSNPFDQLAIASAAVLADGSFSATKNQTAVFAGFPAKFTYSFRGNFRPAGSSGAPQAAGSFRETIAYTDTATHTCTSDDQTWSVTLDAQPAQTTSPPRPGSYSGLTS
ncbi:MAG: eukaryotic-like serine/threonine-protein kinase, partial [Pseudonocardiales bacterium]|nr:eukaryotic-like serine/threonine-protein kinase [Pseudonocardiales bacterium]